MASSSNAERDTTLLHVGKQCSHDHCLLVDFLPFKCQHCQLDFCQEHFKVDVHKCPKYDEAKFNRVAPNCPLCNTPVASKPGQDPNIRMDQHLERECTVVTGRVKTSTMPLCARGTCKKVLFSPIRCDTCRKQYCISHRFPADHTCVPTSQGAPARRPIPARKATTNTNIDTSKALNNLNTEVKKLNVKASVAVDNVKKQVAATTASSNAAINSLPFSKMERRARAERESRLKAMQMRAKRGLLSEEEKVILASEEAAAAESKKDCIIM
ncbi:hypothetical protein BJ165DRAFT_1472953 [Panaeolus papilionaceus]|nr:hypothetical protein BJ165DRAFT_1472953 [Panaeolus papilionaceus]